MSCDQRIVEPRQTIEQRKAQVKDAIDGLVRALAMRTIKAKVGPQGAIAFDGWSAENRRGISDACAYRFVMQGTNVLAKAAIAQAEQMAGRPVSLKAMAHSHDGGRSWEKNH